MSTLCKEYQEFKQLCMSHGCKCTPQRYAVYSFLQGNTTHPTVNQVWYAVRKDLPSITRESVFRILTELTEFGVISRIDKIIDARFDGNPQSHGHFICEKCGTVIDLPSSVIPLLPDNVQGFQVKHVELRISGLCPDCIRNNNLPISNSNQENTPS